MIHYQQEVANKRMHHMEALKSRLLWVMELEHKLHMMGDKINILTLFEEFLPVKGKPYSKDKLKRLKRIYKVKIL